MSVARWQQIKSILYAALEHDPNSIADYLDQACAGDTELRAEVVSLIEMRNDAANFLETKAIELVEKSFVEEVANQAERV